MSLESFFFVVVRTDKSDDKYLTVDHQTQECSFKSANWTGHNNHLYLFASSEAAKDYLLDFHGNALADRRLMSLLDVPTQAKATAYPEWFKRLAVCRIPD